MYTVVYNFIVEIFMVFTLISLVAAVQLYTKGSYSKRHIICFGIYFMLAIVLVAVLKTGCTEHTVMPLHYIVWVLLGSSWGAVFTNPSVHIKAVNVLLMIIGTVGNAVTMGYTMIPHGEPYWGYVFCSMYIIMTYWMDLRTLAKDYHHAES